MNNPNGKSAKKPLGMFALIMMNVIAVDNLRSLTAGAEYGLALIFFYSIAALFFFLPTILVTAELATGWPNTGGVYIWVKEAFGPRLGFFTIWLQWIYNVVWYPTIFSFLAGILAYLINPSLINNPYYMLSIILVGFWGITLLNCLGLHAAHWLNTLSALLGTILPMVMIAGLGLFWLYTKRPIALSLSAHNLLPSINNMNNLAFLTNILFGFMGMEMSAVHAGDVNQPQKNYPRALLFSSLIILSTLVSACLAIALVIPSHQLNLVSGLMDAFQIFFKVYHLDWLTPVLAICIILGSLGGAGTWVIGSARGLWVASHDNALPRMLTTSNKKNMPTGILFAQGIIVTLLSTLFLIMPTVASSYWILSNLTAQLALLFYILMFAAAIRLRFRKNEKERTFKIPGGKLGICLVASIGIFACVLAIALGFLPPNQITMGSTWRYETLLIAGICLCCLPPALLYWKNARKQPYSVTAKANI